MRKMVIDGLEIQRWMVDDLMSILLQSGYEIEVLPGKSVIERGAYKNMVIVNAYRKGGDE